MRMKIKGVLVHKMVVCFALIALSAGVCAGVPQEKSEQKSMGRVISYLDGMEPTRVEDQRETALIQSRADLDAYLASEMAKESALSKLSPSARARFLYQPDFQRVRLDRIPLRRA